MGLSKAKANPWENERQFHLIVSYLGALTVQMINFLF